MFSGHSSLIYALGQLRRSPGFTVLAVVTLALGIGANAAIFSVLNGLVLRPLGYGDPDRLVQVWPALRFTKELFEDLRTKTRSFSALSGYADLRFSLTGVAEAEEVLGGAVSVDHFRLLGVTPALGRGFLEEDQKPGAEQVVVLSHALWQRRFGADREIVGRTIHLAGLGDPVRTVVGVMPQGYRPLNEGWDVWVPLTVDPGNSSDWAGNAWLTVLGRLAPGVTTAQASAEVAAFARSVRAEQSWIPENLYAGAGVSSLAEGMLGSVRRSVLILLGAAGLVLLIACANVASLLLARGSSRERDIAVRMALGARRSQLTRPLLVEAGALGLLGGGVGTLLAFGSIPLLVRVLPASVPRTDLIAVDRWVLLFSLLLSIVASLLSGLTPSLQATKRDVQETLRQASPRTSASVGGRRMHSVLVVAEIALSVVLVAGAVLMLRSLRELRKVDLGFRADGLVTMRVNPPEVRYSDDASLRTYYAQVRERVLAVPGVTGMGMTRSLPMTGSATLVRAFARGSTVPRDEQPKYTPVQAVSTGYFGTMGIPLLEGRDFTPQEGRDGLTIIINRTAAERFWPGEDPLGKQLDLPIGVDEPFTVVGVVGDIRRYALNYPVLPEAYLPYARWTASRMYLAVRVADGPEGRIPLLRSAIWAVDRDVPISAMMTMDRVVNGTLADSRLLTVLLLIFGSLALSLGAVGVYGVVSFVVGQRTYEIGLRMALGSSRGSVLARTLRHALLLAGLGVGIGLVGAAAATRVLSRFLYGVRTIDPMTFVGVAVMMTVVALLASYLPARRASRVDPLVAMRAGEA